MSTDLNASFSEQYMNINTKLKKRFLRKPNISEATNEFVALAIQCEHSEQPAFAAHAYIGAAKCESTAGNFLGEAEHYLAAGRQFMKAKKKLNALKFFSPDRENLEAAIGCFLQALNKYPDKSPIRTSILMELASDLVSLKHKLEALYYYEQALETVPDKTMRVICLRNLVNLLIDCEKYDAALHTANKICDILSPSEDILIEVQISRVLLALLIKPEGENESDSLQQLLAELLNDSETEALPLNTDLWLKLQSIVISHTTCDLQSVITVASDIKIYLTQPQRDLLDTIIGKMQYN